jgi:hypothetical protein
MGRGRDRNYRDWDEQEEDEYEYDYEDEDEDEYEYERRPRRRPQRRRRRQRRVWPILLAGCGLGVLLVVCAAAGVVFFTLHSLQGSNTGVISLNQPQTFTQQNTQKVALSSIAQMRICNSVGNVKVQVDPRASAVSVMSQKIVRANSQAAANQEFGRISVAVQTPGAITTPPTCAASQSAATPSTGTAPAQNALTVDTTIPDSGGFLRGGSDSVDLTVTLPPGVLPSSGPALALDVEAPIGNISVDGVSGVLTIKDSTGNINVSHVVLADGSHIETGQGNVIFNGLLAAPNAARSQGSYIIQCEQGNIDATLPASANVVLDANTNVGAIKSEFPIEVQNNGDGAMSFHGPLTPSTNPQSAPTLVVDVSTGNVILHKAQV